MRTRQIPLLLVLAATLLNDRALAQPFPNDNDGLLDVGEAPGFPISPEVASGTLYLEEQNIEDLDGIKLLTSLYQLGLGNNRIASVESGAFDGLSNLNKLHLNNNQITNLESGAFDGLSKLNQLVLGSNEITNLESGDFHGLNRLQRLSLSGNQITSVEQGDFDGIDRLRRQA